MNTCMNCPEWDGTDQCYLEKCVLCDPDDEELNKTLNI